MRTLGHLNLIWFHHAGARAAAYRPWCRLFPAGWNHVFLEYPGHGERPGPACRTMSELVRVVASDIGPYLDEPCAFFGHSMGALVAYESACELRRRGHPGPLWLGVSARNAPPTAEEGPSITLPRTDDEILGALRTLGGTPDVFLADAAERRRLLATLRADFELCERYRPSTGLGEVPISAFYGDRDPWTEPAGMLQWSSLTEGAFSMRRFAGGHFYLFGLRPLLAATLAREVGTFANVRKTA